VGSDVDVPDNKARNEAISHASLYDDSGSDDASGPTIHSGAPAPAGDVHASGAHADDACDAERNLKAANCEHIGKDTDNKEAPADARSGDSVANRKARCRARCNKKAEDVVGVADNKVGEADVKANRVDAKVAGTDSKACERDGAKVGETNKAKVRWGRDRYRQGRHQRQHGR
jgi:hypothetical protein